MKKFKHSVETDNTRYWTKLYYSFNNILDGKEPNLPDKSEYKKILPRREIALKVICYGDRRELSALAIKRKELGLTQREAAHLLQIGRNKYSRIEMGKEPPLGNMLESLVRMYSTYGGKIRDIA